MLVLTRKSNQSIMIGDEIEVSVLAIMGEKVRIGIQAPRSVPVFRKEVYLEIQQDATGERTAAGGRRRLKRASRSDRPPDSASRSVPALAGDARERLEHHDRHDDGRERRSTATSSDEAHRAVLAATRSTRRTRARWAASTCAACSRRTTVLGRLLVEGGLELRE